jgi:hypothetical protein
MLERVFGEYHWVDEKVVKPEVTNELRTSLQSPDHMEMIDN